MKKKKNVNKWATFGNPTNWHKNDSQTKRRRAVLSSRHGDYLASYRALDQLAKISQDNETARKSRQDANYFLKMYHHKKKK